MIWAKQAAEWVLPSNLPVLQEAQMMNTRVWCYRSAVKVFCPCECCFSENGSTSVNGNDIHKKLVLMCSCSPAGLVGSALFLGVENLRWSHLWGATYSSNASGNFSPEVCFRLRQLAKYFTNSSSGEKCQLWFAFGSGNSTCSSEATTMGLKINLQASQMCDRRGWNLRGAVGWEQGGHCLHFLSAYWILDGWCMCGVNSPFGNCRCPGGSGVGDWKFSSEMPVRWWIGAEDLAPFHSILWALLWNIDMEISASLICLIQVWACVNPRPLFFYFILV